MTSEAGALGLICTKLRRARLPEDLIRCQRLLDRLHAGLNRNPTLIWSPAGFAKFTLFSAPADQGGLIGVINHVIMLGLLLLPLECVSAPVENGPVMEGDYGANRKRSQDRQI